MMQFDQCEEVATYRLALVAAGSHNLLASYEVGSFRLPRLSIAKWTRNAAEIQKAIHAKWNVQGIILDFLDARSGLSPCVVVQVLGASSGKGLCPVSLGAFSETELSSAERATVEGIYRGEQRNGSPFSRIGWHEDAMAWIRCEAQSSIRFTGEVKQLNAGGRFALVQFPTEDGRSCWLKATGEPNLHEYDVTALLAEICAEFLPPVIAMRRDWNAWVTEDAGVPLDECRSLPIFEHCVIAMAELQKKTLKCTDLLLAAGAANQTCEILRGHTAEMMAYLEEIMERQTSTKVPRIASPRLREIGIILENSYGMMEALGIPDAIVHNDLNSGNILIRDQKCRFIDWAEACAGNPFVTFQRLLLLLPRCGLDTEDNLARLKATYKRSWSDVLPSWKMDKAFSLMSLLSIASCLYGRGGWFRSPERYEPARESYARGLARHMGRAVEALVATEALC